MILLPTLAHAADDTTIGGIVRAQVAYDPTRDFAAEHFLTESNFGRLWAKGEFARGDRWFVEGRFQHHLWMADANVAAKLEPAFEGWWDLGLGETGWDGKIGGPVDLRVGALIERWGRLDLLPVADVLNARDFRAGLLAPFEFQKLVEPMAVVAISGGAVRAETVLVPFASADRAFLQGSNWAFIRQGMLRDQMREVDEWKFGANAALFDPAFSVFPEVLGSMDPSLRRNLDRTVLENELPQALIANGEIGERVEFSAKDLDLALMGGWLRSTQASTNINPYLRENVLEPEQLDLNTDAMITLQEEVLGNAAVVTWPRTFVAGADASLLVGPIQVRAEGLWTQRKVVRMYYGQATTVPSVGAGIGLDYVRGSRFIATIESKYTHLFDPPRNMMLTLPDQVQVAALVKWTILNDRIILQGGGLFDPTYVEYAAAGPALSWRASDHVLVELGGMMLVGKTPPPDQLLNAIEVDSAGNPVRVGNANGVDSLTYAGGPASYFQQNDAITIAIQLIR